mgnify:CR=1 FL=1
MIFQANYIKKNSKLIKYSLLAIFIALQSTDLLHDHHEHDHDESHYCVACHAPNIDNDIALNSLDFIIDFILVTAITLIAIFIKKEKSTLDHLPRSPPLT